MTTTKYKKPTRKSTDLEQALEKVTKKIADCQTLKNGIILVRATGTGGGDYSLECSDRGVQLMKGAVMETPPVIEIIGDARRINGVIAGRKDARTHFLAGGFRIRGDLSYFSDLALELGILKDPL
jgi:hypothetical protein